MKYNIELVKKLGTFAMTKVPRDAEKLIAAASNNSGIIGARIDAVISNGQISHEELEQAFSAEEIEEIFSIPRKYDPNYDYTKKKPPSES